MAQLASQVSRALTGIMHDGCISGFTFCRLSQAGRCCREAGEIDRVILISVAGCCSNLRGRTMQCDKDVPGCPKEGYACISSALRVAIANTDVSDVHQYP